MNFAALVLAEWRIRMRRTTAWLGLPVLCALAALAVSDPSTGWCLVSVNEAYLRYSGAVIGLGLSSLFAPLFTLFGFYLLRGRTAADLRSGNGAVIAASPASAPALLGARLLGNVGFLLVYCLGLIVVAWLMTAVRGDGPAAPLESAAVILITLLPCIVFASACAVAFDSVAALHGRAGDVLYFFLWALSGVATVAAREKVPQAAVWLSLMDYQGLQFVIETLDRAFHTDFLNIGVSNFKRELPAVEFPHMVWHLDLLAARVGCTALALLPWGLGCLAFHRYSPDTIRPLVHTQSRSLWAWINALLSPVSRLIGRSLPLAARLPGAAGKIAAEVALTLMEAPWFALALPLFWVQQLRLPFEQLGLAMAPAVTAWGIACADVLCRAHAAGYEPLRASAPGGRLAQRLHGAAATVLLGAAAFGIAAFRSPGVFALAASVGLVAFAGLNLCTALLAKTSRLFLALFFFWLFLAVNAGKVAWFDGFGFNRAAHLDSVAVFAAIAVCAWGVGLLRKT